ncbi:hypothetical protein AB0D13_40590 [Streptomyces sp. NPDC048430]|uniref:hypothetical protein n=1 Tax=Streptomyces sp. NPDC048430 TaxID=3155388 RepID=UPI003449D445
MQMHSHVVFGSLAGSDCVCAKAPCGASIYDGDVYDICPWHSKHPCEGHHAAEECRRPAVEPGRVDLEDLDAIVAWIAGTAARDVARDGHPGHDVRAVMRSMLAPRVTERIRMAYSALADRFPDRMATVKRLAVVLGASYRRQRGI